MSTRRTPRRRRRRAREYGTGTLVLVAAVSVLAAYRDRLVLAVVIAALGGALAAAGLYVAHLRTRTAAARRKARPKTARPKTRPEPQHKAPKRAPRDYRFPVPGRAEASGWLPPRDPVMVSVTAECARDECLMCPAPGACGHDCSHDPVVIVARNRQRYDTAHANGGGDKHDPPIPF
jgi:hypothetical protein